MLTGAGWLRLCGKCRCVACGRHGAASGRETYNIRAHDVPGQHAAARGRIPCVLVSRSARQGDRRRKAQHIRSSAPERTYATPYADTHVRDRSYAHANRTRGGTDREHRQLVTARRYTGLTVTFSRPAESRLDTHTASEVEHTRSVLRSAVGRFSLDPAHHPCHAGAGAGCALSRPSWTASLAQRLRFCDN